MPRAADVTVTMRSRQINTAGEAENRNHFGSSSSKGKEKETMEVGNATGKMGGAARIRRVEVQEDESHVGWMQGVLKHPVYHVIAAVGVIVS